jgi:hypothetical protein
MIHLFHKWKENKKFILKNIFMGFAESPVIRTDYTCQICNKTKSETELIGVENILKSYPINHKKWREI